MDRAGTIEMIRAHILQGERHVASQRAIVQRLYRLGGASGLAEDLLAEFERSLAAHRRHLAQVTGQPE